MAIFNRPRIRTRISGDCLRLTERQAKRFGTSRAMKGDRAPSVTPNRAIAARRPQPMENELSRFLVLKGSFVSIRMESWFGKKIWVQWIRVITSSQVRNGASPVRPLFTRAKSSCCAMCRKARFSLCMLSPMARSFGGRREKMFQAGVRPQLPESGTERRYCGRADITLAGRISRRVKKFGSWMAAAIFRCRRQLWETAWRTLRAATDAGAQCEEFASRSEERRVG